MSADIEAIAERFLAARRGARLLEAPPAFDLDTAYAVVDRIHRLRCAAGERGVGRKIGFTNPRMWAQYGADGPLWGHVYDSTLRHLDADAHGAAAETPEVRFDLSHCVQPKIEPEIVFGLREVPRPGCDIGEVLACVDWVAHGFEMVDSHIAGWRFTPPQAAADFGLHVTLLVGRRVPLARIPDAQRALRDFRIELLCDGEVRDQGSGASVLGHPLEAIVFLVNALAAAPQFPPLRAGEVITTGTLTPALPIAAGELWSTRIEGIGLPGLRMRVEDARNR